MFFVGLLVGAALFSDGDRRTHDMLSQIPLRCLYAFERSEAEYRACRYPSMYREIANGTPCSPDYSYNKDRCGMEKHLDWEAGALRELTAALEAKRKAGAQ